MNSIERVTLDRIIGVEFDLLCKYYEQLKTLRDYCIKDNFNEKENDVMITLSHDMFAKCRNTVNATKKKLKSLKREIKVFKFHYNHDADTKFGNATLVDIEKTMKEVKKELDFVDYMYETLFSVYKFSLRYWNHGSNTVTFYTIKR